MAFTVSQLVVYYVMVSEQKSSCKVRIWVEPLAKWTEYHMRNYLDRLFELDSILNGLVDLEGGAGLLGCLG